MRLTIITGASRGLGKALAEALLAPGQLLVCMARGSMSGLEMAAARKGCLLDARTVNLANVNAGVAALGNAIGEFDETTISAATLINNAGTVEPIKPAEKLKPEDVAASVALNLATPIALTGAFLRITAAWQVPRKVLNISSGAAKRPYHGWGVYCATKAGLDQFSRCVALEQEDAANPARIVSISPGVIDTAIQDFMRGVSIEDFKELPRIIALKEKGALQAPAEVASRILAYLERPDYGQQVVADLREI